GLSTVEVLAYAPEHRPVVQLSTVDVPSGRWLTTGEGLPPRLPVHPWQRDHVLDRYGLAASGLHLPARPLMSLRTLSTGGWHWKTAVDVQMTIAVRTVSAAAVHNGPAVSGLLARLCAGSKGTDLVDSAAVAACVGCTRCRRT